MRRTIGLLGATAIAAALVAATPAAATTVYTDAGAFTAATGATTYNFSFPDYTIEGSSYTVGPVSFSGSLSGYNDAYGQPYLADESGSPLMVTSNSTALGFYFGSYFSDQTVTYTAGGLTGTFDIPGFTSGTVFIGFSGLDGVSPLTFSNADELDTISVLARGTSAVPEPATWAMMILGFGMVGFGMRRSRSSRGALANA